MTELEEITNYNLIADFLDSHRESQEEVNTAYENNEITYEEFMELSVGMADLIVSMIYQAREPLDATLGYNKPYTH